MHADTRVKALDNSLVNIIELLQKSGINGLGDVQTGEQAVGGQREHLEYHPAKFYCSQWTRIASAAQCLVGAACCMIRRFCMGSVLQ